MDCRIIQGEIIKPIKITDKDTFLIFNLNGAFENKNIPYIKKRCGRYRRSVSNKSAEKIPVNK